MGCASCWRLSNELTCAGVRAIDVGRLVSHSYPIRGGYDNPRGVQTFQSRLHDGHAQVCQRIRARMALSRPSRVSGNILPFIRSLIIPMEWVKRQCRSGVGLSQTMWS